MTFATASALLALVLALIIGVPVIARHSDPAESKIAAILAPIIMILSIGLILWGLMLLLRVLVKTW